MCHPKVIAATRLFAFRSCKDTNAGVCHQIWHHPKIGLSSNLWNSKLKNWWKTRSCPYKPVSLLPVKYFLLTLAWLNLWDKHMIFNNINQPIQEFVTQWASPSFHSTICPHQTMNGYEPFEDVTKKWV